MTSDLYTTQRILDECTFDGFPESRWIKIEGKVFVAETSYDPKLVSIFRQIGGAWDERTRRWTFPLVRIKEMRSHLAEINSLADDAHTNIQARLSFENDKKAKRLVELRAAETERRERRMLAEPPRPFRREFLVPVPSRPRHAFSVEGIGDNLKHFGAKPGFTGWVAQIYGSCPKFKFQRAFLEYNKDYTSANSKGSRGITYNYLLQEGPIYQIKERKSWSSCSVYFMRIMLAKRILMTEEEVRGCLERLD